MVLYKRPNEEYNNKPKFRMVLYKSPNEEYNNKPTFRMVLYKIPNEEYNNKPIKLSDSFPKRDHEKALGLVSKERPQKLQVETDLQIFL